jgi:hypothetical protein
MPTSEERRRLRRAIGRGPGTFHITVDRYGPGKDQFVYLAEPDNMQDEDGVHLINEFCATLRDTHKPIYARLVSGPQLRTWAAALEPHAGWNDVEGDLHEGSYEVVLPAEGPESEEFGRCIRGGLAVGIPIDLLLKHAAFLHKAMTPPAA